MNNCSKSENNNGDTYSHLDVILKALKEKFPESQFNLDEILFGERLCYEDSLKELERINKHIEDEKTKLEENLKLKDEIIEIELELSNFKQMLNERKSQLCNLEVTHSKNQEQKNMFNQFCNFNFTFTEKASNLVLDLDIDSHIIKEKELQTKIKEIKFDIFEYQSKIKLLKEEKEGLKNLLSSNMEITNSIKLNEESIEKNLEIETSNLRFDVRELEEEYKNIISSHTQKKTALLKQTMDIKRTDKIDINYFINKSEQLDLKIAFINGIDEEIYRLTKQLEKDLHENETLKYTIYNKELFICEIQNKIDKLKKKAVNSLYLR